MVRRPLYGNLVGGKPQRHDLKIWKGDSPLHLAAEAGHADVCSLLVRAGRASLQAAPGWLLAQWRWCEC
eukprot:s1552_g1.t1